MDRITAEQVRRNREARRGWELYRGHREKITQLLLSSAPQPRQSLCVLGAGNCNDLDLQRLRTHFHTIRLIDLDGEALELGCAEQGVATDAAIERQGGIDVTNIGSRLHTWSPDQPPPVEEIRGILRDALVRPLPGLPTEQYDVVASVGLLTQLIELVLMTIGPNHPQFLDVMSAVRLRHLRLLMELTKPGGMAWLFLEVVSSQTCPELLTTPEANLIPLLKQAIENKNFFTGANPAAINQTLQRDPELAAAIAGQAVPAPWLWNFFTRTYAVCAIGMKKRAD